jgi:hypothetical protein
MERLEDIFRDKKELAQLEKRHTELNLWLADNTESDNFYDVAREIRSLAFKIETLSQRIETRQGVRKITAFDFPLLPKFNYC